MKFNFTSIGDLGNVEKDAVCGGWLFASDAVHRLMETDVIGIVKEVGEVGNITSKATQKPVSLAPI